MEPAVSRAGSLRIRREGTVIVIRFAHGRWGMAARWLAGYLAIALGLWGLAQVPAFAVPSLPGLPWAASVGAAAFGFIGFAMGLVTENAAVEIHPDRSLLRWRVSSGTSGLHPGADRWEEVDFAAVRDFKVRVVPGARALTRYYPLAVLSDGRDVGLFGDCSTGRRGGDAVVALLRRKVLAGRPN